MGQTGSVPQVTRDYDEPLHLRLHFTYNPVEYDDDNSVGNTPFTAEQVATLVRTKWPPFFNSKIIFGGGCDDPYRYYKSDEVDNQNRICLYIPPKRIHLKPGDVRDVKETTASGETKRRFQIDLVTRLVHNKTEPVQTYVDDKTGTYIVRVAESYPLDKLVREAFLTVEHQWHGGGWLEPCAYKQYVKGGDLYFDKDWYEYVPNEPTKAQPKTGAAAKGKAHKGTRRKPRATSVATKKNKSHARPSTRRHVIRFTGFRDPALAKQLEAKGHKVTTGKMTAKVTAVVWDGKTESSSVREAKARKDVTLWRRDKALARA